MDRRRLDATIKGYKDKRKHVREDFMNDVGAVGHVIAAKISQAFFDRNGFRRPIKPFKLTNGKQSEHFRNVDDSADLSANDNKELIQSFDNQFKLFLQEGGGACV